VKKYWTIAFEADIEICTTVIHICFDIKWMNA